MANQTRVQVDDRHIETRNPPSRIIIPYQAHVSSPVDLPYKANKAHPGILGHKRMVVKLTPYTTLGTYPYQAGSTQGLATFVSVMSLGYFPLCTMMANMKAGKHKCNDENKSIMAIMGGLNKKEGRFLMR